MDDRARAALTALTGFYASEPAPTDPVALFRDVVATVPAYASFLAAHGVDPGAVEFTALPLLTKENYLRPYDLAARCRGGRVEAAETVAVSSGSSGTPTVWPRTVVDELTVARYFERVLRDGFGAHERSTLVLVCFALGSWVGGMYTAAACRHVAAKGYPVTVATPGGNIDEILRLLGELGPAYEQVVLAGYPPFVKNIVDEGRRRGVDWPRYGVKLILAGEVFSESWRTLVGERAGMTRPAHDSASLYGTADAGVLGVETPLSVHIRRFLASRPAAAAELFGDPRLPTLVQYDPASRWFEEHEGTLVVTVDGSVPLVRYHIADEGGVLPHAELLEFCRRHGFAPPAGPELPFVYVFGRSLFTVSYFGANVYPENVTVGLEEGAASEFVTGKFVLEVLTEGDEERRLHVAVELAPGAAPDPGLARQLAGSIRAALLRLNSEFANYVPAAYQTPAFTLRPAHDPEYFPPGGKHRWTRG